MFDFQKQGVALHAFHFAINRRHFAHNAKKLDIHSRADGSDNRIDDFVATTLEGHLVPVHHGVGAFKYSGSVLVVSLVVHGNAASHNNLVFFGIALYGFIKLL
jgi:hypothetical protein